MNTAESIRRIYREIRTWERHGDCQEVSWTLRGLRIAFQIVKELAAEEKRRREIRRPRLSGYMAVDLFHAVEKALNYLNRGDRAKAVEVLKKTVHDVAIAKKNGTSSLG